MRSVSGFDRPFLQWLFVFAGASLIVVAAGEAVALSRARREIDTLRAAHLEQRVERQQLEERVAHEQSAREALSLEVARLHGAGGEQGDVQPRLTLTPLDKRGATPPEGAVDPRPANETIDLHLVLPSTADRRKNYSITWRSWSGGEVLWSRSGLRPSIVDGRAAVIVPITGDLLAPGAYEIALTVMVPDNRTSEVASYEIGVRAPR